MLPQVAVVCRTRAGGKQDPMPGTIRGILSSALVGAALAAILVLAERVFGLTGALRFWVGGVMLVLGTLLFSSNPSRILYTKARARGLTDRDLEEVQAARRSNVASGTRLLIVAVVLVLSSFVMP